MKITLDTNCFFDYYERDPALIEELINFQKEGYIEIAITTRVIAVTLDKSKGKCTSLIWQKIQSFPDLGMIGTAFRIGMSRIDSQDFLISKEDKYLMERLHRIIVDAQTEDLDHLFGHIKAKRDIFVSSDNHFLDHQKRLKQEFSVIVLNPSETIQQIRKFISIGRQESLGE